MRYRSMVQPACKAASLIVCVLATQAVTFAGPVRPLYLSTGSDISVIQGISVVDSWATGEQEYTIAVDTTVRTWSQGNPVLSLLGREYQLDGTPTGVTFPNGVGCCFRDGTTDGQFNYAIRESGGTTVYRFDQDWSDPVVMPFASILIGGMTGIAYDSSDDTFWLASSGVTNVFGVMHLTRTGQFLGSFNGFGTGGNPTLAYDRVDDTLWVHTFSLQASQLTEFAASDDMTKPNPPISSQSGIGMVRSIEFQFHRSPAFVPEPATALLLTAGLALLCTVGAPRRTRSRVAAASR
jgi:hypothetical protein